MLGETYELFEIPHQNRFIFMSEGPKGKIVKIVLYSKIPGWNNTYNLGFGDFKAGKLDDSVISGNEDLVKIVNTVAKTIYDFTDKYPEGWVYIEPIDKKRARLFHTIITRRIHEIEKNFLLEGLIDANNWKAFDSEKSYLGFRLKRLFL